MAESRSGLVGPLYVIVLCAAGLALRLPGFHRGMWEDEITSAYYTQLGIHHVIPTLALNGTHPPLYFLVVATEARFHMDALDAIRLPSLVAGVATIPLVYVLATRIAGGVAGAVAAALAAVAPFAIWYSDEGRMYALLWLVILASYLCVAWGEESPRWPFLAVLHAITVGVALWTDYSAALALVPQIAVIALLRRRWAFVASWTAGWLSFVPWLLALREQYGRISVQSFAGQSWSTALLDLTWVRADYASLGDTLPVAAAAAVLAVIAAAALVTVACSFRGHSRAGVTALCLTAGAVAVAAALAYHGVHAVVLARVMGIVSFGVILVVATGAGLVIASRSRAARVAAATCVAVIVCCVSASTTDVLRHGTNGVRWDTVASTIQRNAQPGDELIYYPVGAQLAVDPYLPRSSPWRTQFNGSWPEDDASAQRDFALWSAGRNRVWFVFYAISGVNMTRNNSWFADHGMCRVMGDPSLAMGVIEYEASAVDCPPN